MDSKPFPGLRIHCKFLKFVILQCTERFPAFDIRIETSLGGYGGAGGVIVKMFHKGPRKARAFFLFSEDFVRMASVPARMTIQVWCTHVLEALKDDSCQLPTHGSATSKNTRQRQCSNDVTGGWRATHTQAAGARTRLCVRHKDALEKSQLLMPWIQRH